MAQLELLKPSFIDEELTSRLKELKSVIKTAKNEISTAPDEHLKVEQKQSHTEYYYIENKGDSKGKYIPNRNRVLPKNSRRKNTT